MTADDTARVLDALHRMGAASMSMLRAELNIRSMRVARALNELMADGRVVDEWRDQPDGLPARRFYMVKEEQ